MTPSHPPPPAVTLRDRDLLDRLAQHEPLTTSDLCLLFFTGLRTCRRRLLVLETQDLLTRVYPARSKRGGHSEALWFLSPNGRKTIGAPTRRAPSLSIPDLEHRRDVAVFLLNLIRRSLTRPQEGLYRWPQAQQGTGNAVRPDRYGRYLLPHGEITFYLELDRGSEPAPRIKTKLTAYHQALATDPHRHQGNILLLCQTRRRLANLAHTAPPGPPWVWASTDHEHYTLLPARDEQRPFNQLPASARDPHHRSTDCLGRRWHQPAPAARHRPSTNLTTG